MSRLLRPLAAFALAGAVSLVWGQKLNPVKWDLTIDPPAAAPGGKTLAKLTARIDSGWHLYSLSQPKGGPIPTTIAIGEHPAIASFKIFQPKPETKFDPNFSLNTETYEHEALFYLELTLKPDAPAGDTEVTVQTRFQACTDKLCLPPRRVSAAAKLAVDPKFSGGGAAIPAGYTEFRSASLAPGAPGPPVRLQGSQNTQPVGAYLLVAFGFGLAAIFTPCVFPMIPITLSFFLNREGTTRAASLKQAAIFCLGIIVLFSAMGLSIAAVAGPFGVVQLGANPWVNAFIALVFFVFGISLLGAFEITLPSSLLTRMDRASQGGGIGGTLLMGLTFSLTSFACVGPFVGTLLAASVQRGGLQPLAGMVMFATGLASPFFLLALFPAYLKRLPRSGGWLGRVKVVLGFVVLAAMFKYLSSIDLVLQTAVLTRERFLAAWVVLFALAGLYLLGFLRIGSNEEPPPGTGRVLTGAVFLMFSLSLVPGMFGARLGELDAYVPPATAGPAASAEAGLPWLKNRYEEALSQARQENKLVFVDFTGYACTNCHWMEANMFSRPEIAAALKDLVLVKLYTDGTDEASERNQKLQEEQFSTVAIPFYALMDGNRRVIATFAGLTKDAPEFLKFLQSR